MQTWIYTMVNTLRTAIVQALTYIFETHILRGPV